MNSRVVLSILAIWIGGYVFNSLVVMDVAAVFDFSDASLIQQIFYLLAGGLPVAGWATIFYREPRARKQH